MAILVTFALGLCISFLAALLPGLINMTAAKISLQEGKSGALSFVFGAVSIVLVQTLLAILFARFISNHLEIVTIIQEIAIFIFAGLSVYFFWIAKRPKKIKTDSKVKGKSNRFFFGMLIASINLLPIPFYVFTSISLATSGYFSFDKIPIATFVAGVVSGSFLILYIYVVAFKRIEKKTEFLFRNINTIIGSVTALIAVFTLFKFIYG